MVKKSQTVCLFFDKYGKCSKEDCRYLHQQEPGTGAPKFRPQALTRSTPASANTVSESQWAGKARSVKGVPVSSEPPPPPPPPPPPLPKKYKGGQERLVFDDFQELLDQLEKDMAPFDDFNFEELGEMDGDDRHGAVQQDRYPKLYDGSPSSRGESSRKQGDGTSGGSAEAVAPEDSGISCVSCSKEIQSLNDTRFGLLQSCDHVLCSHCVYTLRKKANPRGLCPVCPKSSQWSLLSAVWPHTREQKAELFSQNDANRRLVDCKYFNFGEGACEFGSKCHYRHAYTDGTLEEN